MFLFAKILSRNFSKILYTAFPKYRCHTVFSIAPSCFSVEKKKVALFSQQNTIKYNEMKIPRLLILAVTLAAASARGELTLPAVISDHMVLQRDIGVPIWGTGTAGDTVAVEFAGQTKSATVGADGKWMVKLDPLKASADARTLTVKSRDKSLQVGDVLVGDVWLASGQSNMGSPVGSVSNAAELLPKINDPLLRFFSVTKNTSPEPLPDLKGKWELATPETAKGFSAVAFFYAQEIRRTQNVPVAILHSSWGGTPIETWISLEGLRRDPALPKTVAKWDAAVGEYEKVKADPKLVSDYEADLKKWKAEVEPAYNAQLKAYNADVASGKAVGPKPQPPTPEPSNPDPMGMPSPSRRPQTPSVAFNATIAPLIPYAIRGVIWYQGEQQTTSLEPYRQLFPRLIEDWRGHWKQGDFPFLFVQLPANGKDPEPVAKAGWPPTREAQFLTLKLPNTGMAITVDIGDPKQVHPDNKIHVGNRLALVGRKVAYGENLVASGPLYQDSSVDGNAVKVRFRETGDGLAIGQTPWLAPGTQPFPQDKLIGFYIAGDDRKWVEADARIAGDGVVVSSPQVPKPSAVRYLWANSPRGNLYNKNGLPAAPFRTDDWQ